MATPVVSLAEFLQRRRACGSVSSMAASSGGGVRGGDPAGERSDGRGTKRKGVAHAPKLISIGDMLRRRCATRESTVPSTEGWRGAKAVLHEEEEEQEEVGDASCRLCVRNGEEGNDAPPVYGSDDDEEEDGEVDEEEGCAEPRGGGTRVSRWWNDKVVHPNGVKNWKDLPNLTAAASYDCRCGKKCLSRVGAMEIYEYRRDLRASGHSLGQGGLRDAVRDVLGPHYNRTQGSFRATFRVGGSDNVCVMAAAVAMGISGGTFSNARRDVSGERPRHGGRCKARSERRSMETEALDAWIRLQREGMEGDKQAACAYRLACLHPAATMHGTPLKSMHLYTTLARAHAQHQSRLPCPRAMSMHCMHCRRGGVGTMASSRRGSCGSGTALTGIAPSSRYRATPGSCGSCGSPTARSSSGHRVGRMRATSALQT